MRSAAWVTPNGSPSSSGLVRPSAITSRRFDAELGHQVADRVLDLLGRVGVVAGRHRGVGGEHGALARRGDAGGQLLARVQLLGRELHRRERGVALVEMDHPGLDPERGERAHAAGAEQHVLGQADVLVGLV